MDKFEQMLESPKRRVSFISVFIVLAVAVRLFYAVNLEHPGHGDMSYYMHLAENIADGRGFVIDYIWHFLYEHPELTHPANDYWQPFTSIIISAFLIVGGKSLLTAIIPSILFGILLSLITYQIGITFFKRVPAASYAAIICLFVPGVFKYSLLTDSTIYYSVFIAIGLLALVKSSTNKKLYLLAAVMAGLAQFTRQDGVLLMMIVVLTILISRNNFKSKALLLTLSIIAYFVTLSPLLISNLRQFGTPFVSVSFQTLFLKSYEDLYSLPDKLTFGNYLEMGYAQIFFSKFKMVVYNTYLTFRSLNLSLLPFAAAGILYPFYLSYKNDNERNIIPLIFFGSLLLLFHSLAVTVVSEQGSYLRSAISLIPFIIVFGVNAIFVLIKNKVLSRSIIIVVLAIGAISCISNSNELIEAHRYRAAWLAEFKRIIEKDNNSAGEIIVMTRAPWELTYSTGYRSVQIPNDDIDTIHKIAAKYEANYLLLPAPRVALESIYDLSFSDKRFKYLDDIDGTKFKIFKIE